MSFFGKTSDDSRRRDDSASRAAGLVMCQTEQELVDAGIRQDFRGQVLHDEQAVLDVERLRYEKRSLGVLAWNGTVTPRIGARERDTLADQPLRDCHSVARLARLEGLMVLPQGAPTGVEEHRVAGADGCLLRAQNALKLFDTDDVASLQACHATRAGNIHEHAARHDRWDSLDAELAGAPILDDVAGAPAVVKAVANLQVIQPVELRSDLEGAGGELDKPVDLVLAPAALGALWPTLIVQVRIRDQRLLPETPRKTGDVRVENASQVEYFAFTDESRRGDDMRGRDLVERAKLVVA